MNIKKPHLISTLSHPHRIITIQHPIKNCQTKAAKPRSQPRLVFTVALMVTAALTVVIPTTIFARPVSGVKGMVATAHPAATQAALLMLRNGGTAADAAAAAAFTLAVVEPYSSGIGGGGFALVKMEKTLSFMDFREVAPLSAKRDMYMVNGTADPLLSRDGILSVAVPGAVAGYMQLQKQYGKLSPAQVLAPANKMAEEGFLVTEKFRHYCEWRLEQLRADPEASRIFLRQDAAGNMAPPPLGTLLKQPDLAKTLTAIATHGAKTFYKGKIAKLLAADMKRRHGLVTEKDLAAYKVRDRTPVVGSYRGHAVVSSPPPSSGGTIVLTVLNVLETLPKTIAFHDPQKLHIYIEASKRAYADRILLGDPDFAPYVNALIPALIDKSRGQKIAASINYRSTPAKSILPGAFAKLGDDVPQNVPYAVRPESPSTTHLSVLDKDGNAVSMTTTVNYGWGSGVVARGTGVVWNDEMDDFAVAPGVPNAYEIIGSEANAVAPGKVPLSSMSPTLVFQSGLDSPLLMVLGSPGGSRIPTTVIQAIVNYIDYNADVEQAIGLGRIHHQHLPDIVRAEKFALEPATIEMLRAMGHTVETQKTWSNATIIAIDPKTGVRTAAADRRGIGTAGAE